MKQIFVCAMAFCLALGIFSCSRGGPKKFKEGKDYPFPTDEPSPSAESSAEINLQKEETKA